MENYYDKDQDRLVFPEDLKEEKNTYEADYESIYEGCSEDIARAFNQSADKLICITTLTKDEKNEIVKTYTKNSKWSAGIMPGSGIRPLPPEFKKILKDIARVGCFKIKRNGVEYGVTLPREKYYFGVIGVMAMPWHLMMIDYEAQRWTDIPHLLKLLMKHESQFAMGITARINKEGTQIDVNEGRHGACEIAMTGAPYCWGRAIVSDNRGRNFDIFDLLNILPKKTEIFDEFRIKNGRAQEYLKHGLPVLQDSDAKIDDQQALDIFQMNESTDVRYVSSETKRSGKKSLKAGDMFRVDKGIDLVKRYGLDTVATGNRILREAFDDSFLPHHPLWAICEIMKESKIPSNKVSKVSDAIVVALQDRYPTAEFSGHRQGDAFYEDFQEARKNTTDDQPFAGYISSNNFVEKFLGTALWSMIQDHGFVKDDVKALIKPPKVEWKPGFIVDKNGDHFNFDLVETSKKATDHEGFENEVAV